MSVARCHEVSVAPLRERFLQMEAGERENGAGGLTPRDAGTIVAKRLGWFNGRGTPDSPRVRRVLGLRPDPAWTRNGKRYPAKLRESVTLDMALRLCEAMGIDPVEFDL